MSDLVKAALCLIVAQVLFGARAKVAPWLFAGESVMGAVAMTSLGAGLLLGGLSPATIKAQLSLKTIGLALAAAGLGIVLHEALAAAAREQVALDAVRVVRWIAPLATLGLVLLIRRESPDHWRILSIAAGTLAIFVLGSQGSSTTEWSADWSWSQELMGRSGSGVLLVGGSTLALAAFLVVAQHLVAASSPTFAASTVLTLGGAVAASMAWGETSDAFRATFASGERLLVTVAYLGLGCALAFMLLFAGLARVKASTAGASFLLAVPLSVAYLLATKGTTLAPVAMLAAGTAVLAFLTTVLRDRNA